MEIKLGDLIQDRYVVKQIMLDPAQNLKEPVFIMFDKVTTDLEIFSKQELEKMLGIKEDE